MAGKLTVVLSQAQGKDPRKVEFEEELAAALMMDRRVDVSIVPHVYDLPANHTANLFLQGTKGPMVVLSWLFPRAARWVLARNGVTGSAGRSELDAVDDDDEDDTPEPPSEPGGRPIFCLDLRDHRKPKTYVDEVLRIADSLAVQLVPLAGLTQTLEPIDSEAKLKRRWYPVIDYSRCTNCMECIDFCLFGVYGIDDSEKILVELQDNCKKGCPACSRVCPENAIIFPQYKSPAIAGADTGDTGGLKIDLSRLFGGSKGTLDDAVAERDAELVKDGRAAVGTAVGLPKRQAATAAVRDDLDDLMDGLDDLDL